jgi:GNAT superfamily N-acetyltransferase
VQKGDHEEIIAIGSYAGAEGKSAEVAFVVREDYQGMGIASIFLRDLEKIAVLNGYTNFGASVLKGNSAMIHIFKKRYPNAKVSLSTEDDYRISMDFFDTVEGSVDWVW